MRPPEEVPDDGRPTSSIEIMKRFVVTSIVRPLLKERLETNHRASSTYEGFLRLQQKIPRPPILATPKGFLVTGMTPQIFQAWGHFVMLGQILRQIVGDAEVIECPRAFNQLPGSATQNFAFAGSCPEWIVAGCGTWYESRGTPLPACLFADALKVAAVS